MKINHRQPISGVKEKAIEEVIKSHFRKLPSDLKTAAAAFTVSEVMPAKPTDVALGRMRIKTLRPGGTLNCIVHAEGIAVLGFLSVIGGYATAQKIMEHASRYAAIQKKSSVIVESKKAAVNKTKPTSHNWQQRRMVAEPLDVNRRMDNEQKIIEKAQSTINRLIAEKCRLEESRFTLFSISERVSGGKEKIARLSRDRDVLSAEIQSVDASIKAQEKIVRASQLAITRLERHKN